jgi:hypothetical protein
MAITILFPDSELIATYAEIPIIVKYVAGPADVSHS